MRNSIRWLALSGLACCALSMTLPATASPSIQTAFSPERGALELVLNTIGSARESIRMMGYSFTSPEVVRALVDARRRGVDVKIVLDEKGNRNRASVAAMNLVAGAGIPVRTNDRYAIMHDKVIVVDGQTVETGSFNYTRAGARKNSENVLVIREMPEVASRYLAHWQSRWSQGTDWKPTY
ncbi:TPA: phospholipase D family protein [Enterobacter roggenkampii]|nr:phospholipase D family protein [Enterobacter roggenkampii]